MAEPRDNPVEQAARIQEDRALLVAFHRGSDAAAEALWSRHAGKLRAHASSLVGASLADDVVQAVFLQVLGLRRKTVKQVRDPSPWLCTLTRHAALNARRQRQRREAREEHGATAAAADWGTSGELSALLDELPESCREALVLRHAYGFTLERLAEALGVSRSTAADRYARGLALARVRVDQKEAQGEPHHVG